MVGVPIPALSLLTLAAFNCCEQPHMGLLPCSLQLWAQKPHISSSLGLQSWFKLCWGCLFLVRIWFEVNLASTLLPCFCFVSANRSCCCHFPVLCLQPQHCGTMPAGKLRPGRCCGCPRLCSPPLRLCSGCPLRATSSMSVSWIVLCT